MQVKLNIDTQDLSFVTRLLSFPYLTCVYWRPQLCTPTLQLATAQEKQLCRQDFPHFHRQFTQTTRYTFTAINALAHLNALASLGSCF